jgi:5-(hydroxymethyl)furfural/furfural oxidase
MGPQGDQRAVVDASCRILGVDNLRVGDLSIVPDIPRANTHLTGVMIGERLAEMMRSG